MFSSAILTIIRLIPLDETPPIHINNHTPHIPLLVRTPQQIKSTNPLNEGFHDIRTPCSFHVCQLSDESSLFPIGVPAHETVYDGGFSSFGVTVVGTDGVDFDVFSCGEETKSK